MNRPAAAGGKWGPLLALTAVVLAAHLALIASSPSWMGTAPEAARPAPMQTRWITVPPPTEPAAPPARARPAPAEPARPVPTRPQTPATEAPTAREEPSAGAAEPPLPAASVASAPGAPPEPAPPPAVVAAGPAASPSTAPAATPGATDPPLPVRIPSPARLLYDVEGEARRLRYHAQAELSWQHDGDRYEARLTVGAFLVGSRTQASSGRIEPQGLAPTRFSDKSRNELAAHFDRERGRIVFSANTPEAALLPGAQDRLSVFVQLAALLAAEPDARRRRPSYTLQTVGAREAEAWQFRLEGEEAVPVQGQDLPAVKLTRHPRREHDARVELWLAPALGYLPARIRITQTSGDRIDQVLRALPPAPTAR